MSFGKLTLLSADCAASGAVVGSSVMVADSSGADGGGCAVAGGGERAARGVLACSAARNVTNAVPMNRIATAMIHHNLFGIAHHPETDRCALTLGPIPPGQSQLRHRGRLPVRASD